MSGHVTAALANFFEADGWPAVFDTDRECFRVGFEGTQAAWVCLAYALDDDEQLVFYSIAPVHADEAHRAAVAEYLTRANAGLILGNFEMNYATGEVRFKTSIDAEGTGLSPPLIRHVLYANVQAMDRYLPGLMLVLADGAAPQAAIERVERPADA
jgi:hypothetical protein